MSSRCWLAFYSFYSTLVCYCYLQGEITTRWYTWRFPAVHLRVIAHRSLCAYNYSIYIGCCCCQIYHSRSTLQDRASVSRFSFNSFFFSLKQKCNYDFSVLDFNNKLQKTLIFFWFRTITENYIILLTFRFHFKPTTVLNDFNCIYCISTLKWNI